MELRCELGGADVGDGGTRRRVRGEPSLPVDGGWPPSPVLSSPSPVMELG